MQMRSNSRVRSSVLAVATPLLLAGAFAGCGCYYGVVENITVSPDVPCLELREPAGTCASVDVTVTNHCADPLIITAEEGEKTKTIAPQETGTMGLDELGSREQEGCSYVFTAQGTLGTEQVTIKVWVEVVNDGLGGC